MAFERKRKRWAAYEDVPDADACGWLELAA